MVTSYFMKPIFKLQKIMLTFIVVVSSVFLFSCAFSSSKSKAEKQDTWEEEKIFIASSNSKIYSVLAITKVKKPWYAWKSLIIKKMKESIPEYKAAEGLQQKFYAFTEDKKLFGGIYVWESKETAQNWFNQAWFDRTEDKYGKKGSVEYFVIKEVKEINFPPISSSSHSEGNFWSVLSLSEVPFLIDEKAKGILKIISIKNEATQENGFVTLWSTEKEAKEYFSPLKIQTTYFDTPVLINNTINVTK